MAQSDQTRDFLPPDDELLRRENAFLDLFDKYNFDEGSDPELVEDANASTVSSESNASGSSFSEVSGCETEDDFDADEMEKQLQPFVTDRINGWAEKGINFQLKTVDPGVTVEQWLEANQEFTTTSKKYKKTVINENNKTTTITTTQTKTTTTRTSFVRQSTAPVAQMQAIASARLIDDEPSQAGRDIEMESRTDQNYSPNNWTSAKTFDVPRGRQKQSAPDRFNLKCKAKSPKVKRLSPQKMKLRNGKKSIPATTSQSDSGFFSNDGSKEVSEEMSTELTDEVPDEVLNEVSNKVLNKVSSEAFNEASNKVFNEVPDEVLNNGGIGGDHENVVLESATSDNVLQRESDRSQEMEVYHSSISTGLSKTRPPEVVVYSPGNGKRFGKRIDDEFMSVTRSDFKKVIDPKYHKYTDFSLMKKCVVPVKQRLVYVPPTDIATKKNSSNDDSETDDDLLTSYTTTGHFYRMNSK